MIREALGMVTLWQVALVAVIAAMLTLCLVLYLDERRRVRRREDRVTHKLLMMPRWRAAWDAVDEEYVP